MLKSLKIENIAVIEKANIEFQSGLNVLTGETGAGKSIVVDSINAVLGERTSKELVRYGADFASVTAFFEDISVDAKEKLIELGIEPEDDNTLLISRKITSAGKSSCRINGSVCTASMVREIGNVLVNIHGQHDSQALLNPDYHYLFVDMLGVEGEEEYKASFKELLNIRRRLKELTKDADDKDRQLELLSYEIEELENADIKEGEWQELKERRNLLTNSQSVISALNTIISAVNGDDENSGIENIFLASSKEVEGYSIIDNDLKKIYDKLGEITDKIESLKDMTSSKLDSIDYSEAELERIEERLDMYYRFSNKYGNDEKEMLAYLESAKERKNSIINSDEELERLNNEYDSAYEKTISLAEKLSESRKAAAKRLEDSVCSELKELDMPKIKFVTDFKKGNLSSTGFDKIEFLISTNPGEPPKPLSKIASGGELSRIMLSIKNVVAFKDSTGTLIFDEIDTGVSGKASRKIGYSLKRVSKYTQVICVTHSAQIASLADNHLLITKDFDNNRTYTHIKSLDFDGRKAELARIMGGIEITETLLSSAEELLNGK